MGGSRLWATTGIRTKMALQTGAAIPFYYQYGSPVPNLTSPAFTPTWGKSTLLNNDGETAILARLTFTKTVRADFKATPLEAPVPIPRLTLRI
jgi:hypothetical protein